MSFRFSFSLLIGLGAVLGHLYLYRRLVWSTVRSRALRLGVLAVLVLMTLALMNRREVQRLVPEQYENTVTVAIYVWMGVALCLVIALLAVDLARGGLALGRALSERVTRQPSHVGPFIRREFMDELVHRANALRPDLVTITGDLVDGDVPTLGESVAALGNLKARFGRFFVTGNHEHFSGDEAWVEFLERLGVQVLRNRHVSVGDAGGSIDLVGVDDWSGGRRRGKRGYDLEQALAGRDPDRAAVLLAHQPANFKVAAEQGVDLQISGHTHGGQLFPMTLFIGLGWEHSVGHYQHGASHLYVSRGCGFWGPPMRVGSPPELVKLVLTA